MAYGDIDKGDVIVLLPDFFLLSSIVSDSWRNLSTSGSYGGIELLRWLVSDNRALASWIFAFFLALFF